MAPDVSFTFSSTSQASGEVSVERLGCHNPFSQIITECCDEETADIGISARQHTTLIFPSKINTPMLPTIDIVAGTLPAALPVCAALHVVVDRARAAKIMPEATDAVRLRLIGQGPKTMVASMTKRGTFGLRPPTTPHFSIGEEFSTLPCWHR